MTDSSEIGAYETKTRLPAFLRAVQAGERFTITQRGKPVAELVPYGTTRRRVQVDAAERMKAFMRKHEPVAGVDVKAMIEEGRD
ncbi:type II toxin-antitoxin system prevent-host-death family antitoxin [Fodinibius sp.]|uniref:type II toxin-antitoxin system Phd/YefM family antitoxin n=1 Tax=Fodinibius sp. TaxID=1872440 RepID=UPI002ACE9765|nr:type II toxin-antitoxin system prevent-host-death family antitoxin [Fodinibius sp.]MDZ7659438.1 type II toxin-antitoxin system prevent-host-death family antitoxin [Fodinibius sp.]